MSKFPSVTARQLVAAPTKAGFLQRTQRGSHLRLFHPDTKRQTVVPMHGEDLKRGTLHGILKQCGISDDEFRKLL
jgi:predicted RNA binding protein YcfA (HicA-like mRNA interferase family)